MSQPSCQQITKQRQDLQIVVMFSVEKQQPTLAKILLS
jgi:hypothetical protein